MKPCRVAGGKQKREGWERKKKEGLGWVSVVTNRDNSDLSVV